MFFLCRCFEVLLASIMCFQISSFTKTNQIWLMISVSLSSNHQNQVDKKACFLTIDH